MQALLASFVPVAIDLSDRSPANPAVDLARRFGIRYLPDLRVLSPEGAHVATIDSSDVNDLIAQLTPHTKP